jgi:UPF0176 protein
MADQERYQIITFYEFKDLGTGAELTLLRITLRDAMKHHFLKGTIIIASEGFNSTLCGEPDAVNGFVAEAEQILNTKIHYKSSFHDRMPFRRVDVKVKSEIVTLKKPVDVSLGTGTHVKPSDWNAVISDPEMFVLDTRNDYEFRNGTFRNAVNPATEKFSELPGFVAENLDPEVHKKVAMFCTGGIRCEKFAPYLVRLGFENVYQLEGGILKYLEEVPAQNSLWEGECFVFDDRITVDENLEKGIGPDFSQEENT